MNRRVKIVIGVAAAAVIAGIAAGGAALAADSGGADGSDVPLSGPSLDRASEAALEATGGGTVVDSEDEENGYEVEVNVDGGQIEVQLDQDFNVVSSEQNEEGDDGDAD